MYLFPAQGDTLPVPIIDFDLKQYFPKEAILTNITSKTVILRLQVEDDGGGSDVKIVSEKAGYGFDEAAIRVIMRVRFRPGFHNGKPVKMLQVIRIRFTLD